MEMYLNVLRTCGLIYILLFQLVRCNDVPLRNWIKSIEMQSVKCDGKFCLYIVNFNGGEYLGHSSWRLTSQVSPRGSDCGVLLPSFEIEEVVTTQWISTFKISIRDKPGKVYFCLYNSLQKNSPSAGKYVHQGSELYLDPKDDVIHQSEENVIRRNQKSEELTLNSIDNNRNAKVENTFVDLSHDTDVNYKNKDRLPRAEAKYVETLYDRKPLYNFGRKTSNTKTKSKREIIKDDNTKSYKDASKSDFWDSLKEPDNLRVRKNYSEVKENDIIKKEEMFQVLNSEEDKNDNKRMKREFLNPGSFIDKSAAVNPDLSFIENYPFIFNDRSKQNISGIIHTGIIPVTNLDVDIDLNKRQMTNLEVDKDLTKHQMTNQDVDMDLTKRQMKILDVDRSLTKRQISEFTQVRSEPSMVKVEGLRVEESNKDPKIVDNGVPSVLADSPVTLRLFGDGFTARTVIAFTYDPLLFGQQCKFLVKGEYMAKKDSITSKSALFEITAPQPQNNSKLYICAKNLRPGILNIYQDDDKYYHQGTESFKTFATHNTLLPLWVSLTLILVCLLFSALFSGLNLGLMSLDRTELKIISNTGTEQERKYAKAIMPVRDHGNYLLCSILLGNVAVNSTFTILLDELTSGLFAVIFSTLSIVLLGEITPQAICSRHGLMVGAKSIVVTKAVMGLTAPLAYPVSKLLDYFLGEEIGSVYNRERLKELVKVTTDVNDLDKDEVNIISGALELRKKTVAHVMTKLEDVFMLPITSVLDFETMSEIIKSGYSRIPVYESTRSNIVTVLFIKDLAFVDPDDNTPLRTLCQYYQNPCNFVFEDVTLDIMFKQFKEGHKGHMAFVHRINNEGEGDPFYETIGLVTLEDVIEEMIQAEIVDETDVFLDNRTKKRRTKPRNKLQDFTAFAERHENQRIHISPQLTLAAFQFLSSSVEAFYPDNVSETVLGKLLQQDVIHHIKMKGKHKKDTYIYQMGKSVDYFVLILEGRVEVTVGRENLVFEAGPFTYFGIQALEQTITHYVVESPTPSAKGSVQNLNMDSILRNSFVPDYSVRAITDVFYLTVKRSLYMAAKRATLMEKGAFSKGGTNEQFDNEVDKLLRSVDEDLSVSGDQKTPSRQVSPNPVSASPNTRASFSTVLSPEKVGAPYCPELEEQEKLLK